MSRKQTEHQSRFPYIRVWGKATGSYDYYITEQVKRAAETNAPHDALFEKYIPSGRTGKWCCLSDLALDHDFRDKCAEAGLPDGREEEVTT